MRLALIAMPWAIFNRPSIQLGALQSYLRAMVPEVTVKTFHPYLDTAAALGTEQYRLISESNWAGEALFSALLFPERQDKAASVFRQTLPKHSGRHHDFAALVTHLSERFRQWLAVESWHEYDLVGFSVCFSQLLPSLYAARQLKNIAPDLPVVLGGSTCTPRNAHQLLNSFAEIDYIITGEGEQALQQLVAHLQGTQTDLGPNIFGKSISAPSPSKPAEQIAASREIRELNSLPIPDYDDYFVALKRSGLNFIPALPLEFSRGCWWNKCTFCNLNLQWERYRFKSSARMLAELTHLQQRYRCLDFAFTDNALPVRESRRFFTALGEADHDIHFFAEIRALQERHEYFKYRRAGLRHIQVGIEALSGTLLERMDKGVTPIENIAAMKYALAAGIRLDGNLILEFPASTALEVEETLQALEAIFCYPPLTAATFFLGQASPVYCAPKKFDIEAITHHPHNRQLFPAPLLTDLDLLVRSYRGDRRRQQALWKPVRKKMLAWSDFHKNRPHPEIPALSYRDGGEFLIIRQERPGGPALHHRLQGLSRRIYLACETVVTRKELLAQFNSITNEQIQSFLNDLRNKNLLYSDSRSYLALAVRQSDRTP